MSNKLNILKFPKKKPLTVKLQTKVKIIIKKNNIKNHTTFCVFFILIAIYFTSMQRQQYPGYL